jgi:quercetin dioxygenase-like cupin family protein
MKTSALAIAAALLTLSHVVPAQDPAAKGARPPSELPARTDSKVEGERDGALSVLHRDDVLRDRGGAKHLWPLLHTPDARMNYFEVTGRGPLHFHPDADHRLYVLEGSVLVTCGATTTKCSVGDFIVIPKGVRHCYDVSAPGEKALLLTFDAPPYDPKKTVNVDRTRNGPNQERAVELKKE